MLRPSERVRPRERSAERDAGKLRSGEQKRGEREARDLQRVADRAAAEQEPRVPSGGAQIRSSAHSQQTRRDDDRDRDEFDMQHWRHVCLLRGLPFESQVEDVVQFIKPVSRDLQPIFDVVLCHCVRKGRTALLGMLVLHNMLTVVDVIHPFGWFIFVVFTCRHRFCSAQV